MTEPRHVPSSELNGFPVDQLHTLAHREALSVLLRAAVTVAAGIPRLMRMASAQGFHRDAAVLQALAAHADEVDDNLRALANAQDGIHITQEPALFARVSAEVRHG